MLIQMEVKLFRQNLSVVIYMFGVQLRIFFSLKFFFFMSVMNRVRQRVTPLSELNLNFIFYFVDFLRNHQVLCVKVLNYLKKKCFFSVLFSTIVSLQLISKVLIPFFWLFSSLGNNSSVFERRFRYIVIFQLTVVSEMHHLTVSSDICSYCNTAAVYRGMVYLIEDCGTLTVQNILRVHIHNSLYEINRTFQDVIRT